MTDGCHLFDWQFNFCHSLPKQELALLTRAPGAFLGSTIPRRDKVLGIASSIWLFPSLLKYRSVLTVVPNVQMWSATSTSRHGNLFKCFVSANAVPQICLVPRLLEVIARNFTVRGDAGPLRGIILETHLWL